MNLQSEKVLVFAYYLSKFNENALDACGFATWKEAYAAGHQVWGIKETTIKNMRDEFDSIMDNNRAGWYQKPLSISRVNVHEQYQNLMFDSFTLIVKNLIADENQNLEINVDNTENAPQESDHNSKRSYSVQRASTGLEAERIFVELFNNGVIGTSGELIDTRSYGCGYDYMETTGEINNYYEVKGRFEFKGGILLTEKEWSMAKEYKDNYHLVLISNITTPGEEDIKIYTNPTISFNPELVVRTVVQSSWNIPERDLIR